MPPCGHDFIQFETTVVLQGNTLTHIIRHPVQ